LIAEADFYNFLFGPMFDELAEDGISVVAITPPSIQEKDILHFADKYEWELGVLVLNNIDYLPHDRSPHGLCRDAIGFVRLLSKKYRKPLFCVYGSPDLPDFRDAVLDAGASYVDKLPCDVEKLRKAIKLCLKLD
jgi:hypothetical protein